MSNNQVNLLECAQRQLLADLAGDQELTARSDMEECDTSKTKVSDSAYSTSCNSRSQRSSGSSKSRHSGSSNSSGYCGHPSTLGSVAEFTQPSTTKRSKEKKKKNSRSSTLAPVAVSGEHSTSESIPNTAPSNNDAPPANPIENSAVNSQNLALGLGPELVLGSNGTSVVDEALQLAIINLTLSFVRKFRNHSYEPTLEPVEVLPDKETCDKSLDNPSEKPTREEEFTAIISMNDGIVKYTSTGLTDVLGFPYNTWTGRCIADFVQPKDRNAFANHVTNGVTLPLTNPSKDIRKTPFFCNIRSYRKNGCSTLGVHYQPCQLIVTFRQHQNGFTMGEPTSQVDLKTDMPSIYMVITITPINSAYTYPEETRCSPKFATRLLASSHLSEVDPGCIPYLGFLPHEMLGASILDFYHPEDMPFLKEVYESVIRQQGHTFLSKPYRFRTQNGGYVLLETEWSSYSNPWSNRLEFISALNRVLKGPQNPDIFAPPLKDDLPQISEEVLKESKLIQEEILCMLNETVMRISDNSKERIFSKRCKVLASYVGSMLEDLKKPDLRLDIPDEQCISERDSVVLGEISPHHDYFDSKSSSETPPSYNQLNYNDNIQRHCAEYEKFSPKLLARAALLVLDFLYSTRSDRLNALLLPWSDPRLSSSPVLARSTWFFESKPKTMNSDESGKEKDAGGNGKNSPIQDSSLGSGDSGGGSGPMSGSAGQNSGNSGSATSSSQHSYKQVHLTEALLTRHNEHMEKQMVQQHKEQRSKHFDKREKYQKSQSVIRGKKFRNHMQPCCPFSGTQSHQQQQHGVKRIGSHSWENGSFKGSKHLHVDPGHASPAQPSPGQPSPSVPDTLPLPSLPFPRAPVIAPVSPHNPTAAAAGIGLSLPVPPVPPVAGNPLLQGSANLCQPFSMTMSPMTTSTPFAVAQSGFPINNGTAGQPLYYMGNQGQGATLRPPFLTGGMAAYSPQLQFLYHPLAAPPYLDASQFLYSPLPILQRAPTAVTTSLFPAPTAAPFVSSQHQPQPQQQQQSLQQHESQPQQQTQQQAQQQQQMGMLQPCRQQCTTNLQRQESYSNKVDYCRVPCSFQRPPSQATSVKAEPGSARDSVASASRQAFSVSSNKNKYEGSPCGFLSPDETKMQQLHNASSGQGEEGSFYSSRYSYLCTNSEDSLRSFNGTQPFQECEFSSASVHTGSTPTVEAPAPLAEPKKRPMRSGPPPWMEGVNMTPEVILRYELEQKNLCEVLSADLTSLTRTSQPKMVDEQLSQLYSELVLEGRPAALAIDEGISSSASSSEEWSTPLTTLKTKRHRSNADYSRLLMIFEDNSPIPSPLSATAAT